MLAPLAALVVSAPIAIQLKSLQPSYKVGEEFRLIAVATNRTHDPILLIGQGDGSQAGRKAPYCQVQLKQPDGSWHVPALPAGCGNTDPIRAEDFVNVPPGKSEPLISGWLPPLTQGDHSFKSPGAYRLRVRYDTTPPIESWLGGPLSPEARDQAIEWAKPMYDKVPKGVFLSNEIQIRIDLK